MSYCLWDSLKAVLDFRYWHVYVRFNSKIIAYNAFLISSICTTSNNKVTVIKGTILPRENFYFIFYYQLLTYLHKLSLKFRVHNLSFVWLFFFITSTLFYFYLLTLLPSLNKLPNDLSRCLLSGFILQHIFFPVFAPCPGLPLESLPLLFQAPLPATSSVIIILFLFYCQHPLSLSSPFLAL